MQVRTRSIVDISSCRPSGHCTRSVLDTVRAVKTRAWVVGSLSALLAVGCSGDAVPQTNPAPVAAFYGSPAAAAIALGATPISVDERGVPRLLKGGPALPGATPTDIAIAHVLRLAPAW